MKEARDLILELYKGYKVTKEEADILLDAIGCINYHNPPKTSIDYIINNK